MKTVVLRTFYLLVINFHEAELDSGANLTLLWFPEII
jgi:hypothetical protein